MHSHCPAPCALLSEGPPPAASNLPFSLGLSFSALLWGPQPASLEAELPGHLGATHSWTPHLVILSPVTFQVCHCLLNIPGLLPTRAPYLRLVSVLVNLMFIWSL